MPFFITFEGIEGSGKSTQLRRLQQHLERCGHRVLATREPGGCPISDAIRAILLAPGNREMTPRAELLLYAAARAQHVEQTILPALAAGTVVLCDRYIDATSAYQGAGRHLDSDLIGTLNRLATVGLTPDITLLLDLPVTTGLPRARRRNRKTPLLAEGRFELEELDFHQRVRDCYLALAAGERRFRVVPADGPEELIASRIGLVIDEFIAERGGA